MTTSRVKFITTLFISLDSNQIKNLIAGKDATISIKIIYIKEWKSNSISITKKKIFLKSLHNQGLERSIIIFNSLEIIY
jgi:hypothetical protein